MLGCGGAHLVRHEVNLEVKRLFTPQGTVVIKHGNALIRFDIGLGIGVGHRGDELDDRLLGRAVTP
ncbi:hypothetical protein D3C81_1793060 [compost metagenome]